MADAYSSPDAPQSTPPMSFLSRLVGVFIEPGETFEDIARKPNWIAPLILMVLVSLAVMETMLAKVGVSRIMMHTLQQSGRAATMDPEQLNQAITKGAPITAAFMQGAAIFGVPIILLIVAGFGLIVLNGFFGEKARFKEVFSATCYAYLPHIVGAVMAIAVMFFADPDAFIPQNPAPTNPGFFMDPATSSHAVYALASSLDIFTLWFLALLAIGLSKVLQKKAKTGSIFMTFLGAWILLIIVRVAFTMLMGR